MTIELYTSAYVCCSLDAREVYFYSAYQTKTLSPAFIVFLLIFWKDLYIIIHASSDNNSSYKNWNTYFLDSLELYVYICFDLSYSAVFANKRFWNVSTYTLYFWKVYKLAACGTTLQLNFNYMYLVNSKFFIR